MHQSNVMKIHVLYNNIIAGLSGGDPVMRTK